MKRIPKGKYTERLEAIYDELRLNADERLFADIVFSNFASVTEDVDSIFDCGYEPEDFSQMMNKLSQFGDFMELLKEYNGTQFFDLLNDVLTLKTNLRHDFFENVPRIIYDEDPLMKSDVEELMSYDKEFDRINKKKVWYDYLKKSGMLDDYLKTLKCAPPY